MTRRLRDLRFAPPVLAVLLAVGSGCAEFGDPWSGIPAGRLEGRVVAGASPVEARVYYERLGGDSRERFEGALVVDEAGSFGLDVPVGDYLVFLRVAGTGERIYYAEPDPVYEEDAADTLAVAAANSPVVVEFALGSLDVDLSLPSGLEGYKGYLRVLAPGQQEGGSVATQIATRWFEVENGWIFTAPTFLLPGEYLVELDLREPPVWQDGYDCEALWLPGTRDMTTATRFAVAAGIAAHAVVPVAVEPLRVSGRVGGAWLDLGLTSNPHIVATDLDSLELIEPLVVDDDGAFDFDLLLPAEFKLQVRHNYRDGTWFGGPRFADAEILAIGPGESITGLEIQQCGLRLVVAAPPVGSGSAWCDLYDATGVELLAHYTVYFQNQYQVGISNLCPGSYLLRLGYDASSVGEFSWLPQWYDRADSPAEARPILLAAPGDIATLDLVFELGGTLAGRLVPSPTSSYIAFVCPVDQIQDLGHVSVYSDGYTFLGLPDGRYKVGTADWEDYHWGADGFPPSGTTWYPSTPDWDAAGVVEIVGGGTVTGVDIVIPSP